MYMCVCVWPWSHAISSRSRSKNLSVTYSMSASIVEVYTTVYGSISLTAVPYPGKILYGVSQESAFREPRAACGAIVGCLRKFSPENPVHVRLRRDLGEENFAYLTTHPIMANDGATDVTMMVAAAIVAIQGMKI